MPPPKVLAPLEIYKLLPQSNCKRCLLPSCLAFAAAVVGGQKRLNDCPDLSEDSIQKLSVNLQQRSTMEPRKAEFVDRLLGKIAQLDLAQIATERGASYKDGIISIASLGKKFHVDSRGQMKSTCHIIPWVQAPILSYICHETHQQVTGRWISFREIKGGIEWRGLFKSRCETPLKQLADKQPDLFGDLIDLFLGQEVPGFEADIALVLHPLPHIPICICYQAPDGDLESDLNIFFDECCAVNLHIKSLYTLCAGLVKMFEQIAMHHS